MSKKREIQHRWALTRGCYSDYRVIAIFEDKATAEAWQAAMEKGEKKDENDTSLDWSNYSDLRIELMEFVPAGVEPHRVDSWDYSIVLMDDGTTKNECVRHERYWAIDQLWGVPPSRPRVRFVRAPCYQGKGGRLEIRGNAEKSVRKVASEYLARWRAGEWITRDLTEWTSDQE